MKKIEAIIREEKVQDIRIALEQLEIYGMTVYDYAGAFFIG
jgi:nitrogen regulatory protein PII